VFSGAISIAVGGFCIGGNLSQETAAIGKVSNMLQFLNRGNRLKLSKRNENIQAVEWDELDT
jgi:hypothetical protein